MYQLIATDMDGTLLTSKREISPRTITALAEAMKRGIKVVLSTGRPIEGIQLYIDKLGGCGVGRYAIGFNGAVVYELTNPLSIKVSNCIHGSDVRKLFHRAKEFGVLTHGFSVSRGLLIQKLNTWSDIEITYNKLDYSIVDFDDVDENESFYKYMFLGNKEQLDIIENQIDDLRSEYTVLRSMDCFIEFLNKKASKGYALQQLADLLDISMSDTVAFGDAQNDEHMLEVAGLSVAMGNSVELLKKKADIVTATNDEDGLAIIVENILQKDREHL
ncbi:MAG: Cof-type HAD-IIB family hydrolase [Succinivibrionaceae bacterium]